MPLENPEKIPLFSHEKKKREKVTRRAYLLEMLPYLGRQWTKGLRSARNLKHDIASTIAQERKGFPNDWHQTLNKWFKY